MLTTRFSVTRRARRFLLFVAFLSGVAGCSQLVGPHSSLSGAYVLIRLDGIAMPVALPSFATCPGLVSYGQLDLAGKNAETPALYDYQVYQGRPCEPQGEPREAIEFARDAGYWSEDNDRVNFSSTNQFGLGSYSGTPRNAEPTEGQGPILQFTVRGHSYVWRRVQSRLDLLAPVDWSVIDAEGRFVNGAKFEFRQSDGLVGNGSINNDRPFGHGASPGISITAHVTLPAGYNFAPNQSNPVTVIAGQLRSITIHAVKTSP